MRGRKTGGRKKGVPNKASTAKAAAIAASGLTPLDYLLLTMRDETAELAVRLEAAKAAAPYVHPRLAAVEFAGRGGGPIEHEHSGDVGLVLSPEEAYLRMLGKKR